VTRAKKRRGEQRRRHCTVDPRVKPRAASQAASRKSSRAPLVGAMSAPAESRDADGQDLRRLEKTDWESVERLSSQRRAIGNMFAKAADALAAGRNIRPPLHIWDARRWSADFATTSKGRYASKGHAAAKCHAVKASAREAVDGSFPSSRGRSLEAWAREVLRWAEGRRYDADALLCLHRLRRLLETETTAPPEALTEVDDALAAGLSPRKAVELLAVLAGDESLLGGGCSFHAPERFGEPTPHADQLDFCARAVGALERGIPLLLCYRTPPSGGKTAAASLLGARLQYLRKARRELRRHLLIYTCFSNHVRIAVAQMLLAASVPFAVVASGVASPSFRLCYACGRRPAQRKPPPAGLAERVEWSLAVMEACSEPPAVLVCDAASALGFCRRLPEMTILFIDEIMAGTESGGCERLLSESCRLLSEAPRITILASATLPTREALAPLAALLSARWSGLGMEYVESDRLAGNVTLVDHDGVVWAPHHEHEDLRELAGTLASEEHRHLLRFYSPAALLELLSPEEAGTPLLLSPEGHRTLALRCLERGEWSGRRTTLRAAPERGARCTSGAWLWPGLTLVVDDPSEYLRHELSPLVNEVPALRRLLKLSARDERRRRGECRVAEIEERAKSGREEESGERRGGRRAKVDARSEEAEVRPAVAWPLSSVVNSSAHLRKYIGEEATRAFPPRLTRGGVPVPEAVLESSDVSLVEAALCGVGVLSLGDAAYEAMVLELCEKMSQVVGGSYSIFGTDLNLQRVALLSEGGDLDDAAALHQLCGRAGRSVDRLPVPGQVVLPRALARSAVRARSFSGGERLLSALRRVTVAAASVEAREIGARVPTV
jgi:hypothetical protein